MWRSGTHHTARQLKGTVWFFYDGTALLEGDLMRPGCWFDLGRFLGAPRVRSSTTNLTLQSAAFLSHLILVSDVIKVS